MTPRDVPTGHHGLALTFYGDDFTGSTDVMEALTLAGIPTVLFLDAPTPELLAAHPDALAIGVAGISRTMSPEEMDATLPGIFSRLAGLRAPLFHYKICSTFDSSPHTGSIGRAAEILRRIFPGYPMPILVAVPELGRYAAFGHLFASAGRDVHRLDRHPVMSRHPVTPMSESDLLVHLAAQTDLPTALVDLRALGGPDAAVDERVDAVLASGAQIVHFDTVDAATQRQVGRTLTRLAEGRPGGEPLVVIGSSGVEYALDQAWPEGRGVPVGQPDEVADVDQTLVIAGSRARVTDDQVAWAIENGFAEVRVDPAAATGPDAAAYATVVVERAAAAWRRGGHVLVRTPPKSGTSDVDGNLLGAALGRIADGLGRLVDVRRLVVAGGDTSGFVARALGIETLRLVRQLAPGAPLCRATSRNGRFDGLEICLKGGKNGTPDYFVRIAALASSRLLNL
ncbi:four-carbon acid sugar kinase family protein [Georgenia yuyongxinii]|uniref:Four-carbon acid sugar kinase family protein n=1 Tax=Georgenia yuyongxinii TaxID=2589797 RepID=A0A552WWN0_9MICO|nr:four-carbon acid sugar kinase family protein [Georgenia yuyongxinii]TRW46703.1 four-carbon acid sugar kinase family protein [Georgenia yuyongxinii]